MGNKCSTKCIYFPMCSYEKNKANFTADKYGTKHGHTVPRCLYDDHIITDWKKNCKNFTAISTNKEQKEKVLIVMGKSAVGKDFLMNELIERYFFNSIISHTTRPMRENEKYGKDYFFIDIKSFAQMVRDEEFIETREYETLFNNKKDIWYYGVSKEEFDSKDKRICVVDTTGLKEISKYYGRENLLVIYLEVEDNIREERARLRGSFSQEEWDRRLKDDNKKFKKINFDYKVTNNGSKEELLNKIENILREEDLI